MKVDWTAVARVPTMEPQRAKSSELEMAETTAVMKVVQILMEWRWGLDLAALGEAI